MPVYIENDANAAALGEFRFGAGRGTRHLLHATLGTGIGGGIVIDGRLYRGAKGFAGEIGHMIIDPAGPVCACGSRGCLEALVSGTAFAERARRLAATGKVASLEAIAAKRRLNGTDLLAAAHTGEALAEAEIRNGGHFLGLALGGLANVLNPDAITLSGGLLGMGELLLGPMRAAMSSIAYGAASGTPVRLTELGDDAGLLGAAAVAFERVG
jgi:glucokinase